MKKTVCAALLCAFAASLCSCSFSGGGASEAPAETVQVTDETRVFSTDVDDYVYPEKKVSKLYKGSFQITGEEQAIPTPRRAPIIRLTSTTIF